MALEGDEVSFRSYVLFPVAILKYYDCGTLLKEPTFADCSCFASIFTNRAALDCRMRRCQSFSKELGTPTTMPILSQRDRLR